MNVTDMMIHNAELYSLCSSTDYSKQGFMYSVRKDLSPITSFVANEEQDVVEFTPLLNGTSVWYRGDFQFKNTGSYIITLNIYENGTLIHSKTTSPPEQHVYYVLVGEGFDVKAFNTYKITLTFPWTMDVESCIDNSIAYGVSHNVNNDFAIFKEV